MRKALYPVLICIVFFVSIAFLRFYNLEADPDVSLSRWSGVFYTDEGWHNGNAINKVLTGNWLCDDRNHMRLMPLLPLMVFFLFKLFGISLMVARLPSVVLSLVTILLCFHFVRKGKRIYPLALVNLFLVGTNYYFFIYSRTALLEIPMISFGVLGLYFYFQADSAKQYLKKNLYIISGIFLSFSLLIKPHGLIFLLALLIHAFIRRLTRRKPYYAPFIITAAVSVPLFFILLGAFNYFILSNPAYEISDLISQKLGVNASYAGNIFYSLIVNYNWFFINALIGFNGPLVILAALSMMLSLMNIVKTGRAPVIESTMISLLVASYLFLGFFYYQPPRYFLVILVPLLYFASILPLNLFKIYKKRLFFHLAVVLVVAANLWNCFYLFHYTLHPRFTMVRSARSIKRDVVKYSKKEARDITLYGKNTAILSLVNNMKFKYRITPESKYVVTLVPLGSGKPGDWMLLNKYRFLQKEIYLYQAPK